MILFDLSYICNGEAELKNSSFREDINEIKNAAFIPLNNSVLKGRALHQGSGRSHNGEAFKD